jgi:hypothetical protein
LEVIVDLKEGISKKTHILDAIRFFCKDVVSISLVWFLVYCGNHTQCGFPGSSKIMMNFFLVFGSPVVPQQLNIFRILSQTKHKLLIFSLYHFSYVKIIFMLYFYSTSIILNSLNFGIWWDVTMEKCRCVMLSLQNTCLLNILKWYWVFFN